MGKDRKRKQPWGSYDHEELRDIHEVRMQRIQTAAAVKEVLSIVLTGVGVRAGWATSPKTP